jgi:hypothetical protein
MDLDTLKSALKERPRVLTVEEASAVAGYVRSLGAIARTRGKAGPGDLGKRSMEELIQEAMKVPEFAAALQGLG